VIDIRPVALEQDRDDIVSLDRSFRTDTIFEVRGEGRSFQLVERALESPIAKTFPLDEVGQGPEWENAWLALDDGRAAGVVATQYETWNRRAVIWHLYVDAGLRRRGIGRRLLETALEAAVEAGMQVAWLETSSVNVPGVRAYERLGFEVSGLDTTLYTGTPAEGEVALFLARPLVATVRAAPLPASRQPG
jgi:ribosomal protein S18 acetylase RimI-like enzyme